MMSSFKTKLDTKVNISIHVTDNLENIKLRLMNEENKNLALLKRENQKKIL